MTKTLPEVCVAHISGARDGVEAKFQPLEEHLLRVARLAGEFAAKAGLPLAGYLAGLVHDLGKYSVKFQNYILSAYGLIAPDHPDYTDPKKYKGQIDHSTAGAQRLWRALAGRPRCKPWAQLLALCVFSHHSGLQDCITLEGKSAFDARINKADAETRIAECLERCDAVIRDEVGRLLQPPVMREMDAAIRALHARISRQLDEAATNTDAEDNKNSRDFQQGLLARFLLSCLLDADRIDSAEDEDQDWKAVRERMPRRPWNRLLPRLEAHLASLEPKHPIDALRQAVSDRCALRAQDAKGLFTLTVPTGGGKTLASLRFALRHAQKHNMDRIIYVIPYTSIIDQNAAVAREILEQGEEEGSIVLEHHSNLMPREEDSESEGAAKKWEKLAENWESPVIFTTMVQFLESLFGSGTGHARRMHNLAQSVLIFDEIQTLPVRCLHMFCNAIDFLINSCGATVVLCTATQPRLDSVPRPHLGSLRLTPDREIVENVPALFKDLKRTTFFDHCHRPMSVNEVADLALEELRLVGSCLVVCNTKAMAEKIYALCAGRADASLYYLSTNLCPAHRLEKLAAMRAELHALSEGAGRKPVLCVSTQLIECGVDISFASVIRFAAGLDSILQAAGRCNRHGGPVSGRVHIVRAHDEDEHLNWLLDIKEGRAIFLDAVRIGLARELQASDNDFTHPDIISAYFEQYFNRQGPFMQYSLGKDYGHETLLNLLGSNKRVASREGFISMQSFASAARHFKAIDTEASAVIVPWGEGAAIIADLCSAEYFHRKKELLRKAQRYSVNIFSHVLQKLNSRNALHDIQGSGILALNEGFYCPETGVVTEPTGRLKTNML